jgi:hypothetical protein
VTSERVIAVRSPHLARPGRRAIVVLDLADLHGPTDGTVDLPLRLFWSAADHTFDLGRPHAARELYETVLREASRPHDLTDFLNRELLIASWPDLHLPAGVRRAWEEQHPVLGSVAARAH